MNKSQRNSYLAAMQIDRWLPRVALPYAAPSLCVEEIITNPIEPAATVVHKKNSPQPLPTTRIEAKPVIEHDATTSPAILKEEIPHFSLQLMQAGNCLLLIELVTGEPLQIRNPAYQLLRNILKAAKLPETPQILGNVIHWPLFKQANIPQGTREAKEFLQSYLGTYQEQLSNNKCLWLMGLPAIHFVTGLTAENFYQTPILGSIGQTLLSPSLELLIEQPQHKAPLWKSISQLIPLWQN